MGFLGGMGTTIIIQQITGVPDFPRKESVVAGENLPLHKWIYINPIDIKAYLVQSNNKDTFPIYGITETTINTGDTGYGIIEGDVTDVNWSFAKGNELCAGLNGAVIKVEDLLSGHYLQNIATAVSSMKITVSVEDKTIIEKP